MASRVEWKFSAFESENDDTGFSGVALFTFCGNCIFNNKNAVLETLCSLI